MVIQQEGKWLAVGGTVVCDTEEAALEFEKEYYKEDKAENDKR